MGVRLEPIYLPTIYSGCSLDEQERRLLARNRARLLPAHDFLPIDSNFGGNLQAAQPFYMHPTTKGD
jgi:hypothetical protein